MRRILVAFIIFAYLSIFSEVLPKDVSPEVPEYGMIVFLVNHGIMDLKNGKFSGSEYVSRYDVARYLYNLIKFIGIFETSNSEYGGVSTEIRKINELLEYDKNEKDFLRILSIEKKTKRIEKLVYKLESGLESATSDINENHRDLENLREYLENLKKRLSNFEKNTSIQFNKVYRAMDEYHKKMEKELEGVKSELINRITDIENKQAVNSKRMDDMEKKLENLRKDQEFLRGILESSSASESYIDALESNFEMLRNEVLSMKSDLNLVKRALRLSSETSLESTPELLVITNLESLSLKKSTPVVVKQILKLSGESTLTLDELANIAASAAISDLKPILEANEEEILSMVKKNSQDIEVLKGRLGKVEEESSRMYDEIDKVSSDLSADFLKRLNNMSVEYDKKLENFRKSLENLEESFKIWMVVMGLAMSALLILILVSSK